MERLIRWVDSAVGVVSPTAALKRAQRRHQLSMYRLASDATLRRVVTDKGAGNTITERHGAKLRDWARHLSRNNPSVHAMIREAALRTSHFQWVPMARTRSGELAVDFNAELTESWETFRDSLEATGALSYRQLRQMLAHSYVRDGEIYAQVILGSKRIGYATDIPLLIRPLESDYLPYTLNRDGPTIVQGVELSTAGAIRAYHVYKSHPAEFSPGMFGSMADTIRIGTDNMLSILNIERTGQVRGVSMLAPSGETMADLDEYLESERIAMKFASTIGLQIVRTPDMATPVLNDDNQRTIDFEPGMVLDQLAPGERAEMLSHDRPGSQFEAYLRQMNRAASAGLGVNYSAVTNDFEGSYSSQRQMLVTAAAWYEHQQSLQIARIERPLHRLFLQALALAGQMPRMRGVDPNTIGQVDFIPPGMPWIDPAKEAQADATAVHNGFTSRHEVIRRRGGNVARIDRELQSDDFSAVSSSGSDSGGERSASEDRDLQRQRHQPRLSTRP